MASDLHFLRLAYLAAEELSDDPSTQNGAVLVRDGKVIAAGANRIPAGVAKSPDRLTRPTKYQFIEHAERDVIYGAAKGGFSTNGTTLYCPWFACVDCARAIILAGIVEVVGHEFMAKQASRWDDSIRLAMQMLREAGVNARHVGGDIGGVTIRFDGRETQP